MSPASSFIRASSGPRAAVLTAAVVLGASAVAGLLMVYNPVVALGAAVLSLVGLAVLRSPDLATFVVVFVLYSNFAVVASRYHGVPNVIATAYPLLLAVPLINDLVLRRQRLLVAPAFPFLLLLLAVQLLSAIFSREYEVAESAVIEFLLEGLLIYLLLTSAVRTPRSLRLTIWALLLAGAATAIVPCYQQLTGTANRVYGGFGQTSETGFSTGAAGEEQLRLAGTIGEQNRYAQNMLMLLPLGLFLSIGERSPLLRLLAIVLTIGSGTGFLLAFSRGGAVAFLLVLATMVAMRIVRARHILITLVVAALGLCALPQYWARLRTIGEVTNLVEDRKDVATDNSIKGRVTEMLAAALVFADHPLIGVGPGVFKYYSQEYGNQLGIRKLTETRKAHSLFLEVAAELGALGLLSFLGLVLVTLHGLVVARRRLLRGPPGATPDEERERAQLANGITGLFLALVAYFASGLFLHLSYIRFFYLMMGLSGAASTMTIGRAGRAGPPAIPAVPGGRPQPLEGVDGNSGGL